MADFTFDNMFRGFQTGLGIANSRFEHAARIQELKSQEALRQAQERQIAMHTAMLMEEKNRQIQFGADMQKAIHQTVLETSPVIPAPGAVGGVLPNPNPLPRDRALLKNVGPVIGQYAPEKFAPFVQDVAMMPYREAAAKYMEARPNIEQSKLDTRLQELEQKHQNTLEILGLKQAQQDKVEQMRIDARKSIAAGEVSKMQWINRHLNTLVKDIRDTPAGFKMKPEEVTNQARKILSDSFDLEMGSRISQEPAPSGSPKVGEVRKGYKFNGKFPPSDKRAWDKMQ